MELEILVNDSGKIVAAVEPRTTKLPGDREVSLRYGLHARSGQTRHVLTVPPELAQMSLRDILVSCRFVDGPGGPRLVKRDTTG
jgi:hypothetical protein